MSLYFNALDANSLALLYCFLKIFSSAIATILAGLSPNLLLVIPINFHRYIESHGCYVFRFTGNTHTSLKGEVS